MVFCRVRLVEGWSKKREVLVGAQRIGSDKLKEDGAEKDMLGLLRGME